VTISTSWVYDTELSPSSLDFGMVEVGETATLPFTISNNGNRDISGTIATPSGFMVAAGGETPEGGRNTLDISLPAGTSLTFTITFAPATDREYTGVVVVATNDPEHPTLNLPVTGSGTGSPVLTWNPPAIELSAYLYETASAPLSIGNSGNVNLEYQIVPKSADLQPILQESFDSGIPGDWWIDDGGNSSDTWFVAETCDGNFLNGTPFAFVNSDAAGSVDMDEYLVSPAINTLGLTRVVLEFDQFFRSLDTSRADVDVWDGSQWVTMLHMDHYYIGQWGLPNHRSMDLTAYSNSELQVRFHYYDANYEWYWAVDNVSILGVPSEFSPCEWLTVNGSSVWADSIGFGEDDHILEVTAYTDTLSSGAYSKLLMVTSNDITQPTVYIPVTLEILPRSLISVDPGSFDFGTVEAGQDSILTFQIFNNGDLTLTGTIAAPEGYNVGSAIRTRQEGQREAVRNTLEFSVAAYGSASYALTFAPTDAREYSGAVVVTSNDPTHQTLDLAVTGIGCGSPFLTYRPAALDLSVSQGGTATVPLTIGNSGNATLQYQVGRVSSETINDFQEDFDSGIPGTWTIVDGGGSTDTWFGTASHNGLTLNGTPFAYVDSDAAGHVAMDECLVSPAINTNGIYSLVLEFDQYFRGNIGQGDVDVWDGSQWVTVLHMSSPSYGGWGSPDHRSIDLTAYSNSALQVRFHYYDANWAWYWAVDNVSILGITSESPCEWLMVNGSSAWTGSIGVGEDDQLLEVAVDADTLSLGSHSVNLRLTSNDPAQPQIVIPVNIMVTVPPTIRLEPDSISCGIVDVGSIYSSILYIYNDGASALSGAIQTIDGFTVGLARQGTGDSLSTGAKSTSVERALAEPTILTRSGKRVRDTFDFTVAAYSRLELRYFFTPTVEHVYDGHFTITSNDPFHPTVLLPVTAHGVGEARITWAPAAVALELPPNTQTTTDLAIGNSGTADLTYTASMNNLITQIDFTESFDEGIPETWTVEDGGDSTATWYALDSFDGFSINGTPFVWVASALAAGGEQLDESLVSPAMDLSGYETLILSFDQCFYRQNNAVANVDVWNGLQWVTVLHQTASNGAITDPVHTSINVTPYLNNQFRVRFHYTASSDFLWAIDSVVLGNFVYNNEYVTITGGNSGMVPIGGQQNLTLSIDTRYLPDGISQASVVIQSNSYMNGTLRVPITITKVYNPVISVTPDSLDFGKVGVGETALQTLRIANTGWATLTGTLSVPDGFRLESVSRTDSLEVSIAVGSTLDFPVTFAPTAEQEYAGSLTITSNDPLQPSLAIPLAGVGIATSLHAPQRITVSASGGNVILNWAAVEHATGYRVWSSTDPYSGFTLNETGAFTGTAWCAPISAARLFYRVTAVRETAVRPATSLPTKDNHNQASQSE
jgi:hypothetical protein